ncbi:MAG: hypothetical protein RLZZ618_403 [Pseudomonadota bacterium]|jgi:putative ABC transport system permease protein
MTLARLAWTYLWARPLIALLNLVLLSLGLASMCFVILIGEQIENGMQRDLAGIDLVVGAKGSPLQLILSGVFHLDTPGGNIPVSAVDTLARHPLVARVVPVSLGDSLQGYRIVGTSPEYLTLYGTRFASGRVWQKPLEAVLGAEVARELKLKTGDRFAGSHGLGDGGGEHDSPYTVVGVLSPQRGVVDRLVLTSTESVWAVHDEHHAEVTPPHEPTATKSPHHDKQGQPHTARAGDDHDDHATHDKHPSGHPPEPPREVTLLLVSYKSPLAAVSLPRWVNAQPQLQAAAPALETAKLLKLVGAGAEVLRGFGVVLLLAAGLSVFIGLIHAVRERQTDLAMMRMLGAPPSRVAALVTLESLWLALGGIIIGLALGHGATEALGRYLAAERSLSLTGAWWSVWELLVPAAAVGLALLSAALPARQAFRLDVTRLLQSH